MFEALSDRISRSLRLFKGRGELTPENIEAGLTEVRGALLEADVAFEVVHGFVERVRERALGAERVAGVEASQQFVHAVHECLVEMMGPEDARLTFAKRGPTVILMAGLQGAGKTTTCAKLARHLRDKHQKRPLMVAADIKRPAAVEQLRVLGRAIDVPVFALEGATPPEVCAAGVAEARRSGHDVVLLDTAGRLHVDDELMGEVARIAEVTQPDAQVLVVDAMTGQDAVRSARTFHERLELTGVILTKLDGDARGGAALSLKEVTGCPVLFTGVGEKVEDLEPFHPERMAGRILGMGDVVGLVEQAQEAISEDEARDSMEKLVMGTFTLEDMLAQLRMVRKLGPMKKVLGMMPGMGKMAGELNVDDKQMNRLEALFTSMTPRERLTPKIMDMSRRRRIARGAGQEVGAVNELLKRYKDMGRMMKQMGKLGMGAGMGKKAKRAGLDGLLGGGGSGGAGGGMDLSSLGDLMGGGGDGGSGGLGGLGGPGGLGGLGGPGGPGQAGAGARSGHSAGTGGSKRRPKARKKKPKRPKGKRRK
ncbi:MAG: signal recognition particle protein [Planctomycetota bacterium]|nr:signal recognition particle protein [Planctomycetota bacterium]